MRIKLDNPSKVLTVVLEHGKYLVHIRCYFHPRGRYDFLFPGGRTQDLEL